MPWGCLSCSTSSLCTFNLWVINHTYLFQLYVVVFFSRLSPTVDNKICSLFVFCLVCILSVFSISVFLGPFWSRAHFCFVSLNITLIVALTEVKPLLISFVYIVGDTESEGEGERVCWKGEEATIVIVLFGSTRAPLVWEEEKDVLCFVYDRVAKAATGNLWACRQAFSDCSTASQPLRSSLLQSITHRSRDRTNHDATMYNLLPPDF